MHKILPSLTGSRLISRVIDELSRNGAYIVIMITLISTTRRCLLLNGCSLSASQKEKETLK